MPPQPPGWPKLIGTVPATAYPTRFGSGLLDAGDAVQLEYTAPVGHRQQDVLVAFYCRGVRLGRLPVEVARWLAPLIGAGWVTATATCIYAPQQLSAMEPVILSVQVLGLHAPFAKRPDLAPVSLDPDDDAALSSMAQAWMGCFAAMEKWKRAPAGPSRAAGAAGAAAAGGEQAEPGTAAAAAMGEDDLMGGSQMDGEEAATAGGRDLEYICEQMGRTDADLPEVDPGPRMISSLRYYQKQVGNRVRVQFALLARLLKGGFGGRRSVLGSAPLLVLNYLSDNFLS